jgi:aspartyl/asparaginyl beta-hydroxylase (cupin superfamily)
MLYDKWYDLKHTHTKGYMIIILIFTIILLGIIILGLTRKEAKNLNKLFAYFCHDPAILDPREYKWTRDFRQNYKRIKEEYIRYTKRHQAIPYRDLDKGLSLNTQGWNTIFLRIFGNDTPKSMFFPKTMRLINALPTQAECTTAYFSILEPNSFIKPHFGIYKGVIRYHLGLIVPQDHKNVFISVNNQKLHYYAGEDILFDDMFIHWVRNDTQEARVILFLDIKRDFGNPILNLMNNIFLQWSVSNEHVQELLKKS